FAIPGSGNSGTTHGSPFTPDTHVPVLFYGTAFRSGRYADEFYISDIAPTLAAALHMDSPSGCIGKPFVKALRNP
ncbi:MAG: alkaline phosphatase family protein, partial [Verrucomicrobiae bacterium]|nr:alkaline phosphatase family protein [Verrucomicrobiae bacterium]